MQLRASAIGNIFAYLHLSKTIIYMAWNGLIGRAGGRNTNYCLSQIFIEKVEGWASPTQPPCTAALSPACMTPSAAAAGSAEGSFTCTNWSTAVPLAYLPSSVAPRFALPPFPAALQGHAFVPPSAAVPGFAYAGTSALTFFWAEITPGDVLMHLHFSPGHST